ncbi:hypothetical protein M3Y99_01893900 [Aphelenchoides fujianensis]|nr:hypothetical protein M3Y99_01893900 [Aphelenchoides fujianensis]
MPDRPRVLHPVCYARNRFTIVADSNTARFCTAGRSIFAFDETNGGAKFAVLDTFYGAEFFVTRTIGEKLEGRVLDCLQVAEGANARTASLVLLVSDPVAEVQLSLQRVDVDFEQKTFVASASLPVVTPGGLVTTEPARRWLHPTDEPHVLVVSVLQRKTVHFFRYDRELQAVARLPFFYVPEAEWTAHDVHVHDGRVFVVQRAGDRLRLVARNERGGWPTCGGDLTDAFDFRQLISSFVGGGRLFVVLKSTRNNATAKIFRLSLAEAEGSRWEEVGCSGFAAFPWPLWTSAFVAGVLCLHAVQRHRSSTRKVDVFYSVRIPVEQPEILSYSTWFEALKRKDLLIEVLQQGPARPLTTGGVCVNKCSFITPEQLLIGRDLDVERCLAEEEAARNEPMEASSLNAAWWADRWMSNPGEEDEEEDEALQQAILASIIQMSAEEATQNPDGAGPSGLQQARGVPPSKKPRNDGESSNEGE